MIRPLVLLTGMLLLSSCGSGSMTTTGTMTLRGAYGIGSDMAYGRAPCVGTGGYSDIGEGAPVTVYDAAGTIVATGDLGAGDARDGEGDCHFTFTVADIPGGSEFYQFEVAQRGRVTADSAEVENNKVALTLGS